MGVLSNKIQRDLLKPGDHIYSWRHAYLYSHHVYSRAKANVREYYQQFEQEQTQSLIDQRIKEHLGNSAAYGGQPYGQIGAAYNQHLMGQPRLPGMPQMLPGIRPPVLPRPPILNAPGIYVGEGKVIHFTRGAGQEIGTGTVLDRFLLSSSPSHSSDSPCPNCGYQSTLDGVISSCIDCFLSGGDLYLFEYGVNPVFFIAKARGGTCTRAQSDPPKDVLHRASFLLQFGFGSYDIFKNNCENFAIYCKTGFVFSGQATSIVAAATVVVPSPLLFLTTSFTGLGVVGCGMYCISRVVSDIGIRRDVKKVPVERLITPCALDESVVATEVVKKE